MKESIRYRHLHVAERVALDVTVDDMTPSDAIQIEVAKAAAEPKVAHTHVIVGVGSPRSGYVTFACSSNPKAPLTVYEDVKRCPFCSGMNPIREGLRNA